MTFDELVDNTMDYLNLTSLDARERVGGTINIVYKKVTSSVGIEVSRRTDQIVTLDPADPDSTLPEVTIGEMEKILRIAYKVPNSSRTRRLDVLMPDELKDLPVRESSIPTAYAVKRMGPNEVTFVLDSFPDEEFSLTVSGYDHADELQGDIEPFLPTDFHDILVEGAMSDELRKMEKLDLAGIAEGNYQQRLSDLRMFIAKSAYMDIYQGKDSYSDRWYNRRWWYRV